MALSMTSDRAPEPLATPLGRVAFGDETWTIDPRELQTFFQAEEVFWTADRTLAQWRRLLAGSRLLTARLEPEGARGGRLVATTRLWSDGAYEAKLYDVVTAKDLMGHGIASTLVTWALQHPAAGEVQRFVLETRDANRLYERFGFQQAEAHATIHMRVTAAELRARGIR
ncbi:MAG TPA: GNAT family N-acetyltransferase [Holophagaceae bacterium]|nr:GNAT family N-acetyltransferase [Holophagaceae bacterium]